MRRKARKRLLREGSTSKVWRDFFDGTNFKLEDGFDFKKLILVESLVALMN